MHKNELTSLRKTNEIYLAEISRLKQKQEKSKKEFEDGKKSNPKLEGLLSKREAENEQVIISIIYPKNSLATRRTYTTKSQSRIDHKAKR